MQNLKIFVGNIPSETKEESFTELVSSFGKLTTSALPKEPDGSSAGYGFAEFALLKDAERFLSSESYLGGKKLVISQPEKTPYIPSKSVRLYVRNLPNSVTDEQFRAFFAVFGKVVSANRLKDMDGVPLGYGFIEYRNSMTAEAAMNTTNSLDGARLLIQYAMPIKQPKKYKQSSSAPTVRMRIGLLRTRVREKRRRVHVANLNAATKAKDLREHFKQFGDITHVSVSKQRNKKGGKFGFVTFARIDAARKSILTAKHVILGRKARVIKAESPLSIKTVKKEIADLQKEIESDNVKRKQKRFHKNNLKKRGKPRAKNVSRDLRKPPLTREAQRYPYEEVFEDPRGPLSRAPRPFRGAVRSRGEGLLDPSPRYFRREDLSLNEANMTEFDQPMLPSHQASYPYSVSARQPLYTPYAPEIYYRQAIPDINRFNRPTQSYLSGGLSSNHPGRFYPPQRSVSFEQFIPNRQLPEVFDHSQSLHDFSGSDQFSSYPVAFNGSQGYFRSNTH